jgi:3'-5' exoribonuclease
VKTIFDLQDIARTLEPNLSDVCLKVINDERFAKACGGAAGHHHSYSGGLAVHTLEVVRYAGHMVEIMETADYDVVVTGAIFHDYMKIHEYEFKDGIVVKTPYRKLVRHVAGSHAEFVRMTAHLTKHDLSEDKKMKIEHVILAHHGRFEYGSPIEPQLVEAYIVHFADALSARYGLDRDRIS